MDASFPVTQAPGYPERARRPGREDDRQQPQEESRANPVASSRPTGRGRHSWSEDEQSNRGEHQRI